MGSESRVTKTFPVAKSISESSLNRSTCNVTNRGACSLGLPSSVPSESLISQVSGLLPSESVTM